MTAREALAALMDLQAPAAAGAASQHCRFDWWRIPALTTGFSSACTDQPEGGATRSFVVSIGDDIVKAYVKPPTGLRLVAVAFKAPGRCQANMPDPIPVVVLAAVGGLPQVFQDEASLAHLLAMR